MASRILFEDDLNLDQANRHETNKNTSIKEEVTDEGNCEQINYLADGKQVGFVNNSIQQAEKKVLESQIPPNSNGNHHHPPILIPIYLGSAKSNNNHEGKTDQVQGKITNISNSTQAKTNDCTINTNSDEGNTTQIPIEEEGKTCADENVMVKICTSSIDGEGKSNKAKGKKRPSELELLGINIKKNDDDSAGEYDVYGDDNKIFKKYKLRKTEQQVSYKEPTDWKPKRRVSSEEPQSLICPICEREFETKRSLQSHVRCHENTVQEYICSLCCQKFDKNADLIAHKFTHNSESFICKQCKLAFSDYCDYQLHNITHSTQSHFKCPECGLSYRRTSYKIHILTHFDKKLTCDICSYVTNGEHNLRGHMNQHNNKRTCVECGKVCHDKKYYDYHMSVHTGVKKYQCLYCGKGFRTNSMLQVHTRIHTGERPYTCDICGHKCKQSTDLKRHKVTHDTERRYTCDMCSKKFLHKEYLIIHMRSHTMKSLYECPECDFKSTSVTGLKVHTMFKHTTERPVECSYCDNKRFINNNQYRKHTRSKAHKRNAYGQMNKEKGNN